jgi:hypothetical protein
MAYFLTGYQVVQGLYSIYTFLRVVIINKHAKMAKMFAADGTPFFFQCICLVSRLEGRLGRNAGFGGSQAAGNSLHSLESLAVPSPVARAPPSLLALLLSALWMDSTVYSRVVDLQQ